MEANSPNICQSGVLLGLVVLGIWAVIRGYQVWKAPYDSRALGLGWYTTMMKWITPKKDRDRVDEMMSNPAVIRFFAVSTLIAGVTIIVGLAVGLIAVLTWK